MIKVGLCGLGFMGRTHFSIYEKSGMAQVVGLMDLDEKRRSGDWSDPLGNLESDWPTRVDMTGRKGYASVDELLADPDVDLIDITLPTHVHADIAGRAVRGSVYSVGAAGVTINLGFARAVLLTRLLLPAHFGGVALALLFVNLSAQFCALVLDRVLLP